MQCPACRAVYSNGLDHCPRCRTSPVGSLVNPENSAAESVKKEPKLMVTKDAGCESQLEKPPPTSSTLIEFPGAGRAARPLWRKELSERVREIQERRSREAAIEAQERQIQQKNELLEQRQTGTPLGLVPKPDQPALNPLVVAALKRIERAQSNPTPTHARSGTRGASVAVARVAREQFDINHEVDLRPSHVHATEPRHETVTADGQKETRRAHSLSVVQSKTVVAESLPADDSSQAGPIFKSSIAQPILSQEDRILAPGEYYDDYAPLLHRMVAGLIDICVIIFASSPFAAIIELTNGNWKDERVVASMGGILLIIMFLYLTSSTSIGGRTWGMSLLSLRAVDVDSGLPPTTKQSVTRAFAYMVSLLTFGVGVLYALVDAEGRGVHDHISGTTVVRE